MKTRSLLAGTAMLAFIGAASAAAQPAGQSIDQAQQRKAMQELSAATSGMGTGLGECPDPEYYKFNPFLYYAIPILCQTPIQTARAESAFFLEERMNKPLPILEVPEFLWVTVKGFGAGVVYLFGKLSEFIGPTTSQPPLPLPPAGEQAAAPQPAPMQQAQIQQPQPTTVQ